MRGRQRSAAVGGRGDQCELGVSDLCSTDGIFRPLDDEGINKDWPQSNPSNKIPIRI